MPNRHYTHAPIAFAIYKLLNETNIADDDIQNIGAILTDIASGDRIEWQYDSAKEKVHQAYWRTLCCMNTLFIKYSFYSLLRFAM
jgi:hypothetical protein